MSKHIITQCRTDDWQAIYLDGKLIDQGHSLYHMHLFRQLAEALGLDVQPSHEFNEDQMEALGYNFPDQLAEALKVKEQ